MILEGVCHILISLKGFFPHEFDKHLISSARLKGTVTEKYTMIYVHGKRVSFVVMMFLNFVEFKNTYVIDVQKKKKDSQRNKNIAH